VGEGGRKGSAAFKRTSIFAWRSRTASSSTIFAAWWAWIMQAMHAIRISSSAMTAVSSRRVCEGGREDTVKRKIQVGVASLGS
jgi:hypothetical protein